MVSSNAEKVTYNILSHIIMLIIIHRLWRLEHLLMLSMYVDYLVSMILNVKLPLRQVQEQLSFMLVNTVSDSVCVCVCVCRYEEIFS